MNHTVMFRKFICMLMTMYNILMSIPKPTFLFQMLQTASLVHNSCYSILVIIITIIIITNITMCMVLSSWQSHCWSSSGSFDECRTAPSNHWPLNQANWLGPEVSLNVQLYSVCY